MIYFNWLHSLSCLNLDWKNNIHFVPFHNFGRRGGEGGGELKHWKWASWQRTIKDTKAYCTFKICFFFLKKVFEGEQQSPDFKNKERSDSW